jgi:hypothetical protein
VTSLIAVVVRAILSARAGRVNQFGNEVTPDSDDSLTLTHVRRRVGRDQRGGGRRPRLASSGAQRRNRAALPQLRVVSGLFWRQMKRPQQLTDLIVRLGDVPHPHFAVQVVAVAAADLVRPMYPASTRSATIRCAARSVIPTAGAMSRIRASRSRAMQSSTWAWLERNVQG